MTALEDYKDARRRYRGGAKMTAGFAFKRADAAIESLLNVALTAAGNAEDRRLRTEEESESLKCCGNCGNYCRIPVTYRYYCAEGKRDDETGHSMTPWSDCLFTPSRWRRREG